MKSDPTAGIDSPFSHPEAGPDAAVWRQACARNAPSCTG
jgi:hypothetical protein